jgi:hypothetical protein
VALNSKKTSRENREKNLSQIYVLCVEGKKKEKTEQGEEKRR